MTITSTMPPASASSSTPAWRFARPGKPDANSLPEAFASVRVPDTGASWLRRSMAFVGPGHMVSVGYIDPGNWATDLQGGAQFGYTLPSVIMLSNFMAIVLQLLFGIPLLAGAVISVLDAFLVLLLINRGFRYLEAFLHRADGRLFPSRFWDSGTPYAGPQGTAPLPSCWRCSLMPPS